MTTPALSYSEAALARPWVTLRRLFSVDVRSLAAFRVGLGALIALDLLLRVPLIDELYTDQGLVPRDLMPVGFLSRTPLDLYRFDGSYAWGAGWLVLTFLCSVLFAIGFRTRWVTVALWVLMSALWRRNQLAVDGGDSLAICLLFWSIFLPLGACWSVDARRREPPSQVVCSASTAALLLQPALLYLVTGLLKNTPGWREGYAVSVALNETQWVRPFGVWLGEHERLARGMTFATRVVEIGAPLLLFLPIFTSRARALAIASLVGLQVGLGASLRLNFFPFYSSVAWLAFVPSSFWDRYSRTALRLPRPPATSARARPFEQRLRHGVSAFILGALVLGTGVAFVPSGRSNVVVRAADALGVTQYWTMYCDLQNDYLRLRTQGVLADGTVIDFMTDRGHLTETLIGDWAASYRGGIVLEWMRSKPAGRRALARFVCDRWNSDPARKTDLVALELSDRLVWQHVPREVPELVWHEACDRTR